VGKTGRMQALADLMSDHKLDFIALQETKKEKISETFLSFVAGKNPFKWMSLPAKKQLGVSWWDLTKTNLMSFPSLLGYLTFLLLLSINQIYLSSSLLQFMALLMQSIS
jgi:hypothetical protein